MSFMPKLCDISEDTPLDSHSPTKSIISIETKKTLNPKALIFIPFSSPTATPTTPKPRPKPTKKIAKFVPIHKPRAKLNIYIGKPITRKMLSALHEQFPNTSSLYHYLDVYTALQISDSQMNIFQTNSNQKLAFINFDLHKKTTQEILYGVVTPNDQDRIKKCDNNKWLWQMDEFLTAKQFAINIM
eukprot:UN04806